MYLVLHILDVEGEKSALCESFDREVKPGPILIFNVVDGYPKVELHQDEYTLVLLTFSTL